MNKNFSSISPEDWEYIMLTCDNCRNRDNYGMMSISSDIPARIMLHVMDSRIRVDWNHLLVRKNDKPIMKIHLRYGKRKGFILKLKKSDFEILSD